MLRIIAATDKGLVRELNEDRFAGEIFDPDCAYASGCPIGRQMRQFEEENP